MTDSRFPERWLNDRRFGQLSPAAQMLYVVGNTFSAANRSDGDLRRDDLDLFPRWAHTDRAHELVKVGLWVEDRDGWLIAEFACTQSTAAQLDAAERARTLDRERKARMRSRNRGSAGRAPVRPDVRADITQDNSGQGQARPGQARPGTGHDQNGHVTPEPAGPGLAQTEALDDVPATVDQFWGAPQSDGGRPCERDDGIGARARELWERGYE